MVWLKRVSLFLITNLLVMMTLSIAWSLISSFFGIQSSEGLGGLMALCLVWGMGGAFISLLLSKFMAKRLMGVQVIDPNTVKPQERVLLERVYRLAERAGLPAKPEVGIYDSPDINAFATGPSKGNSLVAVSTGLLNTMSEEAVEGVLGHEIAHIANGDMVTMTLIQGIINAFVMFFSRIVARIIASQVDERYERIVYFVSTILFDILFTLLGSIVVNYFSRRREFRADSGGARFAGKEKMLAGLRALQARYEQMSQFNGQDNSASIATLKISNHSTGIAALFSTHPPLEERINRLQLLQQGV
jgi:heat shock protein HtpX